MTTNVSGKGVPQTINALNTNAAQSNAIDVDYFEYADVVLDITAGTGNVTYKFTVQYPGRLDYVDLLDAGSATITQTAPGVYSQVVRVGGASSLFIETIDVTTGGYTIAGNAYPLARA